MSGIKFSLDPISSIEQTGALWRRLDEAGQTSFFASSTWIGTWLRCLPQHVSPLLLTASRGSETIAAAILVPRRARRHLFLNVSQLHFNSTGDPALDCLTIEHNGFAAGGQTDHLLWPALQRWFARESGADELVIPGVADGEIGTTPDGMHLLHDTTDSPAFACDLPQGGLDAILAQLSRNARQQLRRNLRDIAQLGELRFEAAESTAAALVWFDRLKALHTSSWTRRGKPHAFRYPFFESFHRALIGAGQPEGTVELLRLSAGDRPVGYLYNFHQQDRTYAYQSGFDDAFANLRPGYVAHALAMARAAARGATRYDFLAGDNRLKRTLGRHAYTMRWHRFGRPKPGLTVEWAVKALKLPLGRASNG